ncbi:MAG: hypothetical protein HY921_02865 [Elusimicrobia bacterium]|nr:hypothetical protein [Elusimicrobiota bacterium]
MAIIGYFPRVSALAASLQLISSGPAFAARTHLISAPETRPLPTVVLPECFLSNYNFTRFNMPANISVEPHPALLKALQKAFQVNPSQSFPMSFSQVQSMAQGAQLNAPAALAGYDGNAVSNDYMARALFIASLDLSDGPRVDDFYRRLEAGTPVALAAMQAGLAQREPLRASDAGVSAPGTRMLANARSAAASSSSPDDQALARGYVATVNTTADYALSQRAAESLVQLARRFPDAEFQTMIVQGLIQGNPPPLPWLSLVPGTLQDIAQESPHVEVKAAVIEGILKNIGLFHVRLLTHSLLADGFFARNCIMAVRSLARDGHNHYLARLAITALRIFRHEALDTARHDAARHSWAFHPSWISRSLAEFDRRLARKAGIRRIDRAIADIEAMLTGTRAKHKAISVVRRCLELVLGHRVFHARTSAGPDASSVAGPNLALDSARSNSSAVF